MAKTPSQMIPLWSLAPDFTLPNVDGKTVSLHKETEDTPFLVLFMCNHCPYVVHIMPGLVNLSKTLISKGIKIFAVNSNDVTHYPDDHPEKMKDFSQQWGLPFPYLFDESQKVAKSYQAACTPDFFLFDHNKKLFYRGQMDNSRPGSSEANDGHSLNDASDALLNKQAPPSIQKPSLGCNIKWKKGEEPDYF